MKIFDACLVSSQHKGYQQGSDSIAVFLNFHKMGEYKDKHLAVDMITKLIIDSPQEAKADFNSYGDVLMSALVHR